MRPGQFLVNKDGRKKKIEEVTDYAVAVAYENVIGESYLGWKTKEQLKKEGWSLLEESWVPKGGSNYYWINSRGEKSFKEFGGDSIDEFNLRTGNYAKTSEDAELYKQKLIETMGRKEG